MNACRTIVAVVLVAAAARPAPAGIIFNRKPKANPNERVVQLIAAVRTEQDDRKRGAAAEELREFDPAQYPEVVPALLECALHDRTPAVRAEAVHCLGKLRPVSQQVGYALEQIVANDSSVRVQVQARSALLSYRLSGYRSQKGGEPPALPGRPKTEEPPLADPAAKVSAPPTPPKIAVGAKGQQPPPRPFPAVNSPEPPLAPETPTSVRKTTSGSSTSSSPWKSPERAAARNASTTLR